MTIMAFDKQVSNKGMQEVDTVQPITRYEAHAKRYALCDPQPIPLSILLLTRGIPMNECGEREWNVEPDFWLGRMMITPLACYFVNIYRSTS